LGAGYTGACVGAGVGAGVGRGWTPGPEQPARKTAEMHAKARRGVRYVLMDMIGSPFLNISYTARFYINLP